MKLFMNDVSISRLDLICFRIIYDHFLWGTQCGVTFYGEVVRL